METDARGKGVRYRRLIELTERFRYLKGRKTSLFSERGVRMTRNPDGQNRVSEDIGDDPGPLFNGFKNGLVIPVHEIAQFRWVHGFRKGGVVFRIGGEADAVDHLVTGLDVRNVF